MTTFNPGDVVLLRFPFTDLSSTKKRPALVLNPSIYQATNGDVVVLALTSQPQKDQNLLLREWKKAGLPKRTWCKPVIGTLATTMVLRRLGKLNPSDNSCVKAALQKLIDSAYFS